MFFSVRDLEIRKIHFEASFPAGEIDFLDPGLHQEGELKVEGITELLSNTLGEIRVKGHLRVAMKAPCDRCLEPAISYIDSDFDLFYRPEATGPDAEEVQIDEGESEIGFYEGEGFALEDMLREHILLSLPMQKLCREDCNGICPICRTEQEYYRLPLRAASRGRPVGGAEEFVSKVQEVIHA